MKRVKAACISQTLHFQLKEEIPRDEANELVKQEFAHYKATPEKNHTKYKIVEEEKQSDDACVSRHVHFV